MRVLITGIAGFAGSHLAEHLLEVGGLEIHGVTLGRHGVANIARVLGQVHLHQGDLCDAAWVAQTMHALHPDQVYHLAAQAAVSLAWSQPAETLTNNILAELNVLEAARCLDRPVTVLVIGSSDEYGLVTPDDLPVAETTPLRPNNPYAVSKIAQDYLGYQYFLSHGLPVIRMRPFNHTGPRQSTGFVVPDFAKQIAEVEAGLRPPVLRVGSLAARRDFTDVRDIVRGYELVARLGEPGEVYNLGSERAYAIEDMLAMLLEMSRVSVKVEQDPGRFRSSDIPAVVSDCAKVRERTGWAPKMPISQTLREVLEYWRPRVKVDH